MPFGNMPQQATRWAVSLSSHGAADDAAARLSPVEWNESYGREHAMPSKRDSIRETCDILIKLLASVKPVGMVAILQEVGTIERDARTDDSDELQAVEQKLTGLIRRLIEQGIVDADRWTEFFGEAES